MTYHEVDPKKCQEIGVNFESIKKHQKLIQKNYAKKVVQKFEILDTGRIENGGILKMNTFLPYLTYKTQCKYAAFIPAAGASSRYLKKLSELILALKSKDQKSIKKYTEKLLAPHANNWAIPLSWHALFEKEKEISEEKILKILEDFELPKALMPAVLSGESFLSLKIKEAESLKEFILGQIFITPPQHLESFKESVKEVKNKTLPIKYFTQGSNLATIRFHKDGQPVYDHKGKYSEVPGGHGALLNLFNQSQQLFPDAEALFIKNIDNVIGTKKEAITAQQQFFKIYSFILSSIKEIRQALQHNQAGGLDPTTEMLLQISSNTQLTTEEKDFLTSIKKNELAQLFAIQLKLFHTPLNQCQPATLETLVKLYARPFNILGQVPNIHHDVGGSPVFLKTSKGHNKLCIEVPHVTEKDKESFLMNPQKATHFNPVFVAAEIFDNIESSYPTDHDYWLLADKTWQGLDVVYYESILYERLGNSNSANVIFLEIPRILFNPHKRLSDTKDKTLQDWTDE